MYKKYIILLFISLKNPLRQCLVDLDYLIVNFFINEYTKVGILEIPIAISK